MVSSLTLLALASGALALKVTSPDSNTIWSTGEKQTIKWDTVSSDESSFNIYLSNKATYPPTDVLIASDVASSDGSYDIDGSKLTDGDSYTINFTNGTKTEQIYAQSVSLKNPQTPNRPYTRIYVLIFLRPIEPVQHHRGHYQFVFLLFRVRDGVWLVDCLRFEHWG